MEILDGILAYRLLISANLHNEQKQLVKATVSKMDYQIMKDQPKKVFTNSDKKDDFKTEIEIQKVMPYSPKRIHKQNINYRWLRYCILQGQIIIIEMHRNKTIELHVV